MDFLLAIALALAVCGSLAAIAVLCHFILLAIKNKVARKIVFVLMCIFFLPAILFGMSVDKITGRDLLIPFNWDVHIRSKGVMLALLVYVMAYAALFTYLF